MLAIKGISLEDLEVLSILMHSVYSVFFRCKFSVHTIAMRYN